MYCLHRALEPIRHHRPMARKRPKSNQNICNVAVVVLILGLAVQNAQGQLWNPLGGRVPLIGRINKAAHAARAAAASVTAPGSRHAGRNLPPAPVAAVVQSVEAASPQPDTQAVQPPAESDATKQNGKEKLGTTGKNETQAGCSCLSNWQIGPASPKQKGCGNPDNDPLGSWCEVDPAECTGFYSMFRTGKGKLRYYDYCAAVRERTKSGCLCASDWNMGDGVEGKAHYRNGCARPTRAGGPRVCKVDLVTCPPGSQVEDMDQCQDKGEAAVSGTDKTWHGCSCAKDWSFRYSDGSTASFSTCANPDDDPQGPWCEVDPEKCETFAIVVKSENKRVSIDYCQSRFQAPEPTTCTTSLKVFEQCGGKSNCTASSCLNAPWPGACCPRDTECRKQNDFFYQCLPFDQDMSVKSYRAADGSAVNSATQMVTEIATGSLASPPPTSPATPDAVNASAAGSRLWVKLRVGMEYDLLMAQAQKVPEFKADMVTLLKGTVGDTKYIYNAGVEEVLPGSVIAVSYIDFTLDAPEESIDAALQQLQSGVQTQYADSKMPAKWGWLLDVSASKDKASVMANPSDINLQTSPPNASKKAGSSAKLSIAALVAIAIAGAVALIAGMLLTYRILNRRSSAAASQMAPGDKAGKLQGVPPATMEQMTKDFGKLRSPHGRKSRVLPSKSSQPRGTASKPSNAAGRELLGWLYNAPVASTPSDRKPRAVSPSQMQAQENASAPQHARQIVQHKPQQGVTVHSSPHAFLELSDSEALSHVPPHSPLHPGRSPTKAQAAPSHAVYRAIGTRTARAPAPAALPAEDRGMSAALENSNSRLRSAQMNLAGHQTSIDSSFGHQLGTNLLDNTALFSGSGSPPVEPAATPAFDFDSNLGLLPPDSSMGPFLRAAIKSLTGQSLGGCTNGSGSEDLGTLHSGDMSTGVAGVNSSSLLTHSGLHLAQSGPDSSAHMPGYAPSLAHQYMLNATNSVSSDWGVNPGDAAPTSSVFQSLWMQRLMTRTHEGSTPGSTMQQ